MLTSSSHIACLSAFKSTGHPLYALLFKQSHRKSQVLLGPTNKEAMVHHRNAVETNGKVRPC